MKESILYKYFQNEVTDADLAFDFRGSQQRTGYDTISVTVDSIEDGEFEIDKKHLIKLCNAHLNGFITDEDLNTIGFALMASDFFNWDTKSKSGKIVGEVITDWENENIGYDINKKNVWHWRRYLETGFNNLDKYELDLKIRNKGTHLKLYRDIDQILCKEWDPIGVSDLVQDEYQTYVPQIFRLRKLNKYEKEIEDELYRIETQTIGMPGNRENCQRIAKMIIGLKLESDT